MDGSSPASSDIPEDETPTQKQARLRRERRAAKLASGGSDRLQKIMNVSGRQQPPIADARKQKLDDLLMDANSYTLQHLRVMAHIHRQRPLKVPAYNPPRGRLMPSHIPIPILPTFHPFLIHSVLLGTMRLPSR